MSTYRGVNFHDLCRVCTSHTEQRISIFSADGKSKNLCTKIADCLSLTVDEKDRLPKVLCVTCLGQVEEIYKFRNICKNSQNVLSDCLKQAAQHNSGKIYIKDGITTNTGKSINVVCNNTSNIRLNGCAPSTLDVSNTPQYTAITPQPNFSNLGSIPTNNDVLNSIMQSIGIQQTTVANQADKPLIQEYTITMDSKGALKTEPVPYKSDTTPVANSLQNPQPVQQQRKNISMDCDPKAITEFLKMKPNIKVTPLGKNNNKKIGEQQQPQQVQLQSSQIINQQDQHNNTQHIHIQQQQPLSQSTTAAASLQLQQLQQQLQQFQLQQQLQQLQQITSQLQPQPTITLGPPPTPAVETSPSKSKKPKLNFVLTSPPSQTLTASLPQLSMNAGTQPPQIQLQLQAPQTQSQATAATLLSNLAPFLQQQSAQTHNSSNILQTPTPSTTPTTLVTSPNKCYLPITIKDENSDQQIVAHIDAKNFMLPTTYQLQMKVQPQIATVDGQPIMQLAPTSIPATLQLAASALNSQSFQTITGNMLQTIPTTIQSSPPQQHQQQAQMHQLSLKQPAAHVTSQQIIRSVTQFTNDVATSTNEQIEDFVPNKIDNNKQFPKPTEKVIKQQKYRLSQQASSGNIEITPTTNFTQEMQQVTKQNQQQQKQQKPNPQQQAQESQKEEQQLQAQKQLQDVVTLLRPQSHNGGTVQRVTNKTTMKTQQQKAALQQPPAHASMQTKIPMLQKNDVTISRISNTAQTQQQQQDQQQALLKLLPASTLDIKSKTANSVGTQIQQQQQPQMQFTSKQQDTQSQQNQAPNAPSSQKIMRQTESVSSTQSQSHFHTQQQQSLNTINDTAANARPPQQQQQFSANSTEKGDTKVKTEGVSAHGVGPNGLECSQCGRVFKKKEHLTQHVKLHAGLRPFKCKEEQCGKAFSRKEHLMRHEISHSGRKLFSCDVCHKPFSRKDNLNKHRRIHTTGTNLYNCEICNKQFAVRAYYEEHKQMHEDAASAGIGNSNQKNEKTTNGPNTINADVAVQHSQDASRQQQQTQLLQQTQQQQTQLLQQAQQQQTQLLQQSQQNQQQAHLQQHSQQQQQTHLLQHSQQQQQQQPELTAIPPSLMSTNQSQTQQIQIVQHQAGNTQFQQQHQQQHIMQLQLPSVVGAQELAGNTITITQSHDPTLKATIGSHDATVLNLPSSLANLMQLSHAQFVNTATGQIMGHIKIEK